MRIPFLVLVLLAAACSSSGSPSGSTDDAGAPDAPRDALVAAPDNCVPKGYVGNDFGVGAFCDETTTCPDSTKAFLVCTAYHDAPSNAFFCTAPCTADSDCGMNAYCDHNPRGSGCVPNQCGSPSDAGATDASIADAPSGG